MQIIKKASQSKIFKIILMIVAFMFISVGFGSIFQDNNDDLITTKNSSLNLKLQDVFLYQALHQEKHNPYSSLMNKVMKLNAYYNIYSQYGINITDNDIKKFDKNNSKLEIEKINNPYVIDFIKKKLVINLIDNITSYEPMHNLVQEFANVHGSEFIANQHTIKFSDIKIDFNELANIEKNLTESDLINFYNKREKLFTKPKIYVVDYIEFENSELIDKIDEKIAAGNNINEIIREFNLSSKEEYYIERHFKDIPNINLDDLHEGYISYVQPIKYSAKAGNFFIYIKEIKKEYKIAFDAKLIKEIYMIAIKHEKILDKIYKFAENNNLDFIVDKNKILSKEEFIPKDETLFYLLLGVKKNEYLCAINPYIQEFKFNKKKFNLLDEFEDFNFMYDNYNFKNYNLNYLKNKLELKLNNTFDFYSLKSINNKVSKNVNKDIKEMNLGPFNGRFMLNHILYSLPKQILFFEYYKDAKFYEENIKKIQDIK